MAVCAGRLNRLSIIMSNQALLPLLQCYWWSVECSSWIVSYHQSLIRRYWNIIDALFYLQPHGLGLSSAWQLVMAVLCAWYKILAVFHLIRITCFQAKRNREIAALQRKIDEMPTRAELGQYQKRFLELYNQGEWTGVCYTEFLQYNKFRYWYNKAFNRNLCGCLLPYCKSVSACVVPFFQIMLFIVCYSPYVRKQQDCSLVCSVAAKHKETKQFYTMYNTLEDTKVYLEKEVSIPYWNAVSGLTAAIRSISREFLMFWYRIV